MKSKSFDLTQTKLDKTKHNKTFDFVGYYKSATETNNNAERNKSIEGTNKENNFKPPTSETPKRQRSNKKYKVKNELLNISQINIDGQSLDSSVNKTNSVIKAKTSTPCNKKGESQASVKSIMKNSSTTSDEAMETTDCGPTHSKSKKRNKSVSFMLEDSEELVIKRTKSDDSLKVSWKSDSEMGKNCTKGDKGKRKDKKLKAKKNISAEGVNKLDECSTMSDDSIVKIPTVKKHKNKIDIYGPSTSKMLESTSDSVNTSSPFKTKRYKKYKKQKETEDSSELTENESTSTSTNDCQTESKDKKSKKKKYFGKSVDCSENDSEPKIKSRKTEMRAEVIAKKIGNLSIGDNTHTLTSMLDEMTVTDKNKKKKTKTKNTKSKKEIPSTSSSETADLEKKEKVKWIKRRWNKVKRDDSTTTVIIENLPGTIVLTYKTLLADKFAACGRIKKIGIAEFHPTEETKLIFTTSITFENVEAVDKALEEDNTLVEGHYIRVRRPLPATETSIVVRSYGELSTNSLSSVFAAAGKIKNIRFVIKGKKCMGTAFIDFDGPESVEKAINMAADVKIGGRKIHVSKYEHRPNKRAHKDANIGNSEIEGNSDSSND